MTATIPASAFSLARLGLRPVINASATLTRLGGSLMAPETVAAMAAAATHFTDIPEMQRAVGAAIAEMTNNEACYVSSGAAAGIAVTIAGCLAGQDPELTAKLPYLDDVPRRNVIIHKGQRNGYDFAARQTGARLIEVGGSVDDVAAAIDENTVAVLWFAGAHFFKDAAPVEEVVRVAHAAGVPLVVDAAAQIPPITNLWHFTREIGADVAVFSGGKGLRGPQPTGLVLGRREMIENARYHGSPNYSIGRPMKVGKEELAGILTAVGLALQVNEPAVLAGYEATVQGWIVGLRGIPGFAVERGYPSEAGQPHSRTIVRLLPGSGHTRDGLIDALWEGEPRIAVGILE
ncbi:MAG: aminotransferase class V-fold PLP-dependent enzyme, partial [Thermomicrobiales bacterium]